MMLGKYTVKLYWHLYLEFKRCHYRFHKIYSHRFNKIYNHFLSICYVYHLNCFSGCNVTLTAMHFQTLYSSYAKPLKNCLYYILIGHRLQHHSIQHMMASFVNDISLTVQFFIQYRQQQITLQVTSFVEAWWKTRHQDNYLVGDEVLQVEDHPCCKDLREEKSH